MRKIYREELDGILEKHELWLKSDGREGERADLTGADLSGVDLYGADLSGVNLTNADLFKANLSEANLSDANLSRVDLIGANLSGANLSNTDLFRSILSHANLSDANLFRADLFKANLSDANLSDANLSFADLTGAKLSDADLFKANLLGVNLSGANLSGANLSGADLLDANLSDARLSETRLNNVMWGVTTAFFGLQCPEEGSFVGYKKCRGGVIVKLLIPEDAKRSSATTRKCRSDKAIVLEIVDDNGNQIETAVSHHDSEFIYKAGEMVKVDNFDENRWNECSTGIHFFITRAEAENY